MVRLVVENEDIFHPHEFGHHALDHLAFGLVSFDLRPCTALEQRATAFRDFEALAEHERVVIRDDDLSPRDFLKQVVAEPIRGLCNSYPDRSAAEHGDGL